MALACILAGAGYGLGLWLFRGADPAQQYAAGYLIELSLSADNAFVFALVFAQLGVEPARRRRLLLWGVAGAAVFRSALLIGGLRVIARFSWIVPVLGAFILATAVRIAVRGGRRRADSAALRAARRLVAHAPPAVVAIAALETADLAFALDSLPAVLGVTRDASVAVASNLFAVLALRSLYSVVSEAMARLRFLGAGLAAVLAFVGAKMLAAALLRVPNAASAAFIAAALAASIGASLLFRRAPGR